MTSVSNDLLLAAAGASGGGGGSYNGVAFSEQGSSNTFKAYRLTYGVGWGAAISTPAFTGGYTESMSVNPATNASIVFTSSISGDGYARAYAWSNSSGFGTRYSNPVGFLRRPRLVKFTNNGDYVVATISSTATPKRIYAWPWDDATGFGTKIEPSVGLASVATNDPDIDIASDDSAIILNTGTSPVYIAAYSFSSSGFGSLYSNPPTNPAGYVRGVAFHPNVNAVACAHSISPYITVYAWDSSTGFGAKYSNPSTAFSTTGGNGVAFTRTGAAIIAVGDARRQAWAWDSSVGFGTAYSDPASASTTTAKKISVADTNDMLYIRASTSLTNISAYEWDDVTGFGTFYNTPLTGWNGQGGGDLSNSS